MRLTWIFSIMITAMPVIAAEKQCVVVRMQGSVAVPQRTLIVAEGLNREIFRTIGISIKWMEIRDRKTDPRCVPILMEFLDATPQTLLPGALGYAMPYQQNGTRFFIFIDRVLPVQRIGGKSEADLAFVIAHEVGHILQGVSRHSGSGIMKSHYRAGSAATRDLSFSREDATLIHSGLQRLLEIENNGTREGSPTPSR